MPDNRTVCPNCGGEGGWATTPADGPWTKCPTCCGIGWLDDDPLAQLRDAADLTKARVAFLRDGLQYARGRTRQDILRQIAALQVSGNARERA